MYIKVNITPAIAYVMFLLAEWTILYKTVNTMTGYIVIPMLQNPQHTLDITSTFAILSITLISL